MRNWNTTSLIAFSILSQIASLPMRNWNRPQIGIQKRSLINCQPTYEELKLDFFYRFQIPDYQLPAYLWGIETGIGGWYGRLRSLIASLPMRNWNWIRKHNSGAGNHIASLPMRNWNLSNCCGPGKGVFNCQPTYEELKRLLERRKAEAELYCQPTYEELKLRTSFPSINPAFWLPAYLWGIETRLVKKSSYQFTEIASLPMRNWNLDILEGFLKAETIASLPMRNWNSFLPQQYIQRLLNCQPTYEELKHESRSARRDSKIILPAYLWGIETRVISLAISFPSAHCQPTYEELKRRWNFQTMKISLKLPAYLWGIETVTGSELWPLTPILPAYLWGIETWYSEYRISRRWSSLPAYLWGIETSKTGGLWRKFCLDCQPTYEELKRVAPVTSGINRYRIASLPMRNWNRWLGKLPWFKH